MSERAIPPRTIAHRTRAVLPGAVLATGVATLATGANSAVPALAAPAAGLVLGILISLAHRPGRRWRPGLSLVGSRALRAAIVVFGTGLAVPQVAQVGLRALPLVLTVLLLVAVATPVLGRLLGVHGNVRTLVGVASGICGTSAIAAISPIIAPSEVEITYAVGSIFALNTVSVFTFPLIGGALGMSQETFGQWAGVAVHDTSSVVAAGLSFGATAGSVAIVVKLCRTLALIPVSLFLTVRAHRAARSPAARTNWVRVLPLFLVGFLTTAAMNSTGLIPVSWHPALTFTATFLVTAALSAIGLSLRPADLVRTGPRPFLLALSLWTLVTVVSLTVVWLLHGHRNW